MAMPVWDWQILFGTQSWALLCSTERVHQLMRSIQQPRLGPCCCYSVLLVIPGSFCTRANVVSIFDATSQVMPSHLDSPMTTRSYQISSQLCHCTRAVSIMAECNKIDMDALQMANRR
ncbi:hypothetical protein WJX77_002814 [Trebouxia sp. C0004]